MVQWQRLLAYTQKTMVRVHPGSFRFVISDLRLHLMDTPAIQPQIVNQQSQIIWLSRQLVDHLGLEPWMLWVRIPPELFTSRPRGAARSARHPVKVEIRGSNPLGDAFSQHTTTRYAIWKSGVDQPASMPVGARNLRDFVGSTPTRVNGFICVG